MCTEHQLPRGRMVGEKRNKSDFDRNRGQKSYDFFSNTSLRLASLRRVWGCLWPWLMPWDWEWRYIIIHHPMTYWCIRLDTTSISRWVGKLGQFALVAVSVLVKLHSLPSFVGTIFGEKHLCVLRVAECRPIQSRCTMYFGAWHHKPLARLNGKIGQSHRHVPYEYSR